MEQKNIYTDDELDTEWAQYVASLRQNDDLISRKNREKKKIEERERETMINLQKHVRGLSRARIELEDAACDSFDDSSSDTGTVNILETPISDKINKVHHDFDSSDSDDVAPTPSESDYNQKPPVGALIGKPITSSSSSPKKQEKQQKQQIKHSIVHCRKKAVIKPMNTVLNIMDDNMDNLDIDSQDSDINDSHSLESTNCSQDSRDTDSNDDVDDDDDDDDDDEESKCSNTSEIMDEISDLQYDEELEALKMELNIFKRRNYDRLRRTKSQEELLLSVLNIDQRHIDAKQLEKCTKKAINKYNSMTQKEKKRMEKEKIKSQNDIAEFIAKKPSTKDKLFEYPAASPPVIMKPIPESPMPGMCEIINCDKYLMKNGQLSSIKKKNKNKNKNKKKKMRKLADPYNEEWNGLDPDDYQWFDDLPEGECYDDNELSLRNRRIQYLVVMAIENHYCTISDLTYKQNELLLLYQQSLIF